MNTATSQKTERLWVNASPEELREIELWRGKQVPIPSRSEAMRALIKLGLQAAREQQQKERQ